MKAFEETLAFVNKLGYRLWLTQDSRTWSATALGNDTAPNEDGVAMYSRGNGFGATPDDALRNLVADLKKKSAAKTEKPPKQTAMDIFG